MTPPPKYYKSVHLACGWHEESVRKSEKCGCFYCLRIYDASAIIDWVKESEDCPRGPGKTALCPYCGIDAVIPDEAGYELTDQLLSVMHSEYF
jgi:hypothetical protein